MNSLSEKLLPATDQAQRWAGSFGREYTDRNSVSLEELDSLCRNKYGFTRTELNRRFLQDVPRAARVLEVGCNIGNQLLLLREMGFENLYGIEIQEYALQQAKQRLPTATLTQASALQIPYPDLHFDLVFTSGVLIHIAPADLQAAMNAIYRCAARWIWGFEYYAPQLKQVVYRGQENLLWKADYAQMYLENFATLKLAKEERLKYLDNENVDSMFLLERVR